MVRLDNPMPRTGLDALVAVSGLADFDGATAE
jgi:hypothetical protein